MFNKRAFILALTASALSGVVINTSPAAAATVCNSPTIYLGWTFPGGIVVPPGGQCHIAASTVDGPVTVGPGGSFRGVAGSTINGSDTAQRATVLLLGAEVRGGVQIQQPVATPGLPDISGSICGSSITGSIAVQGAPSSQDPFLIGGGAGRFACGSLDNTVGGDVVFQYNQVPSSVADNRVGGRVICLGNNPAPYHAGNQPASRTYGQCAES